MPAPCTSLDAVLWSLSPSAIWYSVEWHYDRAWFWLWVPSSKNDLIEIAHVHYIGSLSGYLRTGELFIRWEIGQELRHGCVIADCNLL